MDGAVPPVTRSALDRHESLWVMLLVLAGLGLRLAMLAHAGLAPPAAGHVGEATNLALSVARDGVLGDPFGYGSGPSAHLGPVMPLIAGGVFRVFGGDTPGAELALALFAIGCVLATAVILHRIAVALGVPLVARLAGVAALCLVPLNINLEVTAFRVWEGAFAAASGALLLWRTIVLDRRGEAGVADAAGGGLLLGGLVLVNPPLGLAGLVNALLLARRATLVIGRLRWAAIGAVSCAIVLLPWTVRNAVDFHRIIPIRDNAGLEMRLAFNDFDLAAADQPAVYRAAYRAYHPSGNPPAFRAMQRAGGEAPYYRRLGRDARAWMATHPRLSLSLAAYHLRNFYLPSPWIYAQRANRSIALGSRWRAFAIWPVSLAGLATILGAAWRPGGRFRYLVAVVTVPAMPFMVTHPGMRYSYLVYAPTMFAAAAGVAMLAQAAWNRRGRSRRP